mmetsp:Transcript_138291/g.429931  ORF Transcript_138291/g.429931 Transcript_138291/m.429931 type:complete len:268 (-) Transcript_138291:428-1231(-)
MRCDNGKVDDHRRAQLHIRQPVVAVRPHRVVPYTGGRAVPLDVAGEPHLPGQGDEGHLDKELHQSYSGEDSCDLLRSLLVDGPVNELNGIHDNGSERHSHVCQEELTVGALRARRPVEHPGADEPHEGLGRVEQQRPGDTRHLELGPQEDPDKVEERDAERNLRGAEHEVDEAAKWRLADPPVDVRADPEVNLDDGGRQRHHRGDRRCQEDKSTLGVNAVRPHVPVAARRAGIQHEEGILAADGESEALEDAIKGLTVERRGLQRWI